MSGMLCLIYMKTSRSTAAHPVSIKHLENVMVDATGKNANQQNGKSMDNLALIEAFVAVARFESFTKAASHLKISPGALSRAINNLEAHTQVTLFHRSTRHVALAEDAREYLALCVETLERLRDGEQRLLSERNEPKGVLRVVAHPIAIEAGLTQVISQYQHDAPDVSVIVSTSSEPLKLEHGTCDVAVCPPGHILDGRAVYRPLLRSPVLLVASRTYLDRHRSHRSPLDFAKHVLVLCGTDTAATADLRFERDAGVARMAGAAVTMVVDAASVIRLALSGFGMALVPEVLVSRYLEEGRLQLVVPGYEVDREPAELGVGFIRNRTVPRRTRNFIDACVAHFRSIDNANPRARIELAA
ncbi:LysR family transcriptional regulator [Paraburkholderia sp. 1N]|uniref:LysR family transcriptional regulator n=2 Tax=Paraburkholderia solitsugae TaxID=2675748 RepID=A0ABX2BU69_9BURK|nr:LysR family transcriptional regulator [Paraburkholderia solitsugae]